MSSCNIRSSGECVCGSSHAFLLGWPCSLTALITSLLLSFIAMSLVHCHSFKFLTQVTLSTLLTCLHHDGTTSWTTSSFPCQISTTKCYVGCIIKSPTSTHSSEVRGHIEVLLVSLGWQHETRSLWGLSWALSPREETRLLCRWCIELAKERERYQQVLLWYVVGTFFFLSFTFLCYVLIHHICSPLLLSFPQTLTNTSYGGCLSCLC